MASYKDLEIYKSAFDLAVGIHKISLQLPNFELYEQGSQLRRSSKRIKDTIAEGYGRGKYKQDFIKFLIYAHASCDETLNHLETICQLYPEFPEFRDFIERYELLGKMINKFIRYVEKSWNSFSEPESSYTSES